MIEHDVLDAGLGDADDDDFDLSEVFDSQLPDNRYLDRELSWLAFNQRVLELAEDPALPVLERANFLAIFASNLDEFFMVRVAGLKRRIITGLAVPTNVGRSPQEVLADISADAHALQLRHADAWTSQVRPALAEAGIDVISWDGLEDDERARLSEYFQAQVFPVLMPLAVDPAHPFPYISGLSLNLAIRIRNARTGRQEFARLKVPPMLPRFVDVSRHGDTVRYLPLEELIANHLDDLFPGMEILDHHAFRLTRNEDVVIEEDETENLIQALEAELLRRRFGPPIRLEVGDDMDDLTLDLLISELDITAQEVYRLPGSLDLRGLFDLAKIDRPELHYPPHVPTTRAAVPAPASRTAAPTSSRPIRKADVLVHHPYESFATSVQAFLEQAAKDPHVLAIKQTLYRTSGDSPIVQALIDAAESGKQVLALVEVKARFDEAANIVWARKLEKAGVHVVYGLVGLKTHCKLALVIREEDGRAAPLQPRRHRQLQPEDEPHLRGLRPVHRRRPGRPRPDPALQRAVRLRDREEVQASSRRAPPPAQGTAAAHRQGAPQRPGGQARPASASRSTRWSTSRSSTRSTGRARPASPSTCGCAASARSSPASRA